MEFLDIQFYDMLARQMQIDKELYNYIDILFENNMLTLDEKKIFDSEINFNYDINDLRASDEDFIKKNFSSELKSVFDKCISTKDFALKYYSK